MRLFLSLFLLVLTSSSVFALDLYVNNSGSPVCSDATPRLSNSELQPWCTLLRAVRGQVDNDRNSPDDPDNAARGGDTVYVTSGTYDYDGAAWSGSGFLDALYLPVNGGSPGNWIRFVAERPVVLTSSATIQAAAFGATTEYVEWNGFTVTETATWFRESFVIVTVDNVRLYNNVISSVREGDPGNNHVGIIVHGPRGVDCLGGVGNIHIRNNEIFGFGCTSPDANCANGMTLYCAGYDSQVLIENNYIHSNEGYGIYAKEYYIDPVVDPSTIIRYNLFQQNGFAGIRVQSWMNWHVYQNVITGAGLGIGTGIQLVGQASDAGGSSKPRNIRFVNNTFDGMDFSSLYYDADCTAFAGNVVRNNIFLNSLDGIATEDDLTGCEDVATMGVDNVDHDDNVYEITGAWWPRPNISWATWQAPEPGGYGQDNSSSITTDCRVVNPAAGDYRLCTGPGAPEASCVGESPCLVGGPDDGIDVLDLNNNGQTTDPVTIGAYITGDEVIGIGPELDTLQTGALFLIAQ